MAKSRSSLFHSTTVAPGEYGKPEHPRGWIVITDPALGKQRIFVASRYFREPLSTHYHIPETHIVSLIDAAPDSRRGIPEEPLEGETGLQLFQHRLEKINGTTDDVIIHCQQGQNRSPVAAVIYLMNKGFSADKARDLVTKTYQQQRNANFILNKWGHYTNVLNTAAPRQNDTPIATTSKLI